MNKPQKMRSLFVLIGVLALILIVIGCGIRFLDSAVFSKQEHSESTVKRKTITVDGVDYFPRQDITVFLAMGIDKEGKVESSNSYNNDGEADVISLIVFNDEDKTVTILNLNRDTMVEMPELGIGGKRIGSRVAQLALSHTYGDGLEESCENTRETVSSMLKGVKIDYYIAANIDAVGFINDAVGGVKVNVTDDFSSVDSSIPKGEVTLKGQQAVNFVRLRKEVGDQLNISRMSRQEEYVKGFIEALNAKIDSDGSFAYDFYKAAEGYFVTDCSFNAFSGMFDRFAEYTLKDIVTPEGENTMGERFVEFYLDEDKFEDIILDIFYIEKS